jgi:hypothetical protein
MAYSYSTFGAQVSPALGLNMRSNSAPSPMPSCNRERLWSRYLTAGPNTLSTPIPPTPIPILIPIPAPTPIPTSIPVPIPPIPIPPIPPTPTPIPSPNCPKSDLRLNAYLAAPTISTTHSRTCPIPRPFILQKSPTTCSKGTPSGSL